MINENLEVKRLKRENAKLRRVNGQLMRSVVRLSRKVFWNYDYNGLYTAKDWKVDTGKTHTWDQVKVTKVKDNGCWTLRRKPKKIIT